MDIITSRRALIGGAGLSVVAVAASALAATATTTPTVGGVSFGLANLIAEAARKDGLADEHHRIVLNTAVGEAAIHAAIDENNALNDAYADALDAVAFHPVSTVADLRTKLAFMTKHQMGDGRDWLEEINADVLRIASAEGR